MPRKSLENRSSGQDLSARYACGARWRPQGIPTRCGSCTASPTACPAWWSTATPTCWSRSSSPRASSAGAKRSSTLLVELTGCEAVYERSDAEVRKLEGLAPRSGFARGNRAASRCPISEYGLNFRVDVEQGQKTGFFLDQRENRQRVRALAAGREVLDGFATPAASRSPRSPAARREYRHRVLRRRHRRSRARTSPPIRSTLRASSSCRATCSRSCGCCGTAARSSG